MSAKDNTECCGLRCLKAAFHVFQILLLVSGTAICIFGTIHYLKSHHFMNILNSSIYYTIVYLFLATGCLVILVFLLGYCAIPKHRTKLLFCYILFLVVIFLTEALVGVLSYIYHDNLDEEMHLNYNSTILDVYKYDDSKSDSIDHVQQKLKCCGAVSYLDWKYSKWTRDDVHKVPDSCCKTPIPDCGLRDHPSNIYYTGCIANMTREIQFDLWLICAIALGLSLIQVLGVIFSVILYLKLESKKHEENYSPSGNETLLSDAFN